jgi:hypothetical protein
VQPQPRPEVYDAYWRLAAERQRILFARIEGLAQPWTSDPILAAFKFCNAYRASDRVSQWLITEVIYGGGDYTPEDRLFRIVLARLFSKPETWGLLRAAHGDPTWRSFDRDAYGATLDVAFAGGQKLYTAAFILCATKAFGHARKHRNHLALVQHMVGEARLARSVARARSLHELVTELRTFPLLGPFMSYQLAIDINYSELCDFSESEYTVAGPGALRGIAKCFSDTAGLGDNELILWMTARQEEEFERLGIEFRSLYGRRLQGIDIQNLLCELDKYARVAFPELKSARKRIKARFTPAGPLPHPFYPPKWGLQISARRSSAPARRDPRSAPAREAPGRALLRA